MLCSACSIIFVLLTLQCLTGREGWVLLPSPFLFLGKKSPAALQSKRHPSTTSIGPSALQSAVRLNRGLLPMISCPDKWLKQVSEWPICWPILEHTLKAGKCLVYVFGVAEEDEFTMLMTEFLECEVYAFDPSDKSSPVWEARSKVIPNLHYRNWGLKSADVSAQEERKFTHPSYGSTSDGLYLSFSELREQLNHVGRPISVFKMDCEGCEWAVFHEIYTDSYESTNAEIQAFPIVHQWFGELHFSTGLRFDVHKAIHYLPSFEKLLTAMQSNFFFFKENIGSTDTNLSMVQVPHEIVRAGALQFSCCREFGVLHLPTYQQVLEAKFDQVEAYNSSSGRMMHAHDNDVVLFPNPDSVCMIKPACAEKADCSCHYDQR